MLECFLNVVCFYGAHFKNLVFNHVVMAADVLDNNDQLVIIALAIVPSESTESWTWFLQSLADTPLGRL